MALTCSVPSERTCDTLAACEAWRCECSNEPLLDGFLMRNPEQPELGEGLTDDEESLCATCRRVYDVEGRERRRLVAPE
jgi:hypothetical protein